MAKLDIALLPALDALLTNANVTHAASQLGISQPAMSAKLARLRDLTGDQLLVASGKGRGMVLTPYGLELRDKVRAALIAVEQTMTGSADFDPATDEATFRIIANDNAASAAATIVTARATDQLAPYVRIAFLRPDGRGIVDRLEAGEADLAISAETIATGERLHRHVMLDDRYATAQRKGHPRGTGSLGLDEFCMVDHVIVSETGDFTGSVDAALRDGGRERRVALSLNSYLLAPVVVAKSDLVVTLPSRLFDEHVAALDLFEPPLALPRVILNAYWHERTDGDAANRWLRALLFEAGGSAGKTCESNHP